MRGRENVDTEAAGEREQASCARLLRAAYYQPIHLVPAMLELQLSDVVRINHLAIPSRDVDGPAADPPQPRVGELAVVVGALGDDLYLIEHTTDDGRSLWIAEFHVGELELINHGAD